MKPIIVVGICMLLISCNNVSLELKEPECLRLFNTENETHYTYYYCNCNKNCEIFIEKKCPLDCIKQNT